MIFIGNNLKNLCIIVLTIFFYNIARFLWNKNNFANNRSLETCTSNIPFKIVMPFHINQQQKIIDNIKSWKQYKPCVEKNINVELVIFYGHSLDSFADKELFISNISKHIDQFCFQRLNFVEFKYKSKEDDSSIRGARLMFEHMLYKNDNAFKNIDFIFYMDNP